VNKIIELCRERITYGYNRIWALLRNSGIRIARKTVYKIMKNNNLTLPLHTHKNRKELKLLRANRPGMLIETDITYIPTNLHNEPEIVDKKLRLASTYLEFFIVFRALNSKKYQQSSIKYTMYSLTKQIRNKNINELGKILKDRVLKMDYTIDGVGDLYVNGQNKNFIRFILAKITSHMEEESDRKHLCTEYWANEANHKYDIEHIIPSNSFIEYKNEFDSEEEFKDYRNKIGGLLILPSRFNKSYGAKCYEEKVKHYYSQNLLAASLYKTCYENNLGFLNYILASNLDFKPYTHFGKIAIDEQQALYEEILKDIYNVDIFSKIVSG
jgi:hypothetical protein